MPNITISDLPPVTLPIDGVNTFLEVSVQEAGVEVSRKITADELSSAFGLDATFVTVTANVLLPNERILTAGTNVSIVDGGAGGTITIDVTIPALALGGLSDVDTTGQANNDLLFRSGGVWIDTAGLLTWDGVQFTLPTGGVATLPTLTFGDGDSGFLENPDNQLFLSIAGTITLSFSNTGIGINLVDGARMLLEAPSATNPVFVFNSDLDTGMGRRTTNVGVLIGGAQNCMEFAAIAAAPAVGFYATAAIVQQTGVAVTAAGIHAALVNLGLITA